MSYVSDFAKLPDGSMVRFQDVIAIELCGNGDVLVRLAGGVPAVSVHAPIADVRAAIFGPEPAKQINARVNFEGDPAVLTEAIAAAVKAALNPTVSPLESAALTVREATKKHADALEAYYSAERAHEQAREELGEARRAMSALIMKSQGQPSGGAE
jgi:hypothetical protein